MEPKKKEGGCVRESYRIMKGFIQSNRVVRCVLRENNKKKELREFSLVLRRIIVFKGGGEKLYFEVGGWSKDNIISQILGNVRNKKMKDRERMILRFFYMEEHGV